MKLYEKLVIIAISIETNSSNSKSGKIDISSVYTRFEFCCIKIKEMSVPNFEDFKGVIYNLYKMNIIDFNDAISNFVNSYVSICKTVYRDELITAFSSDKKFDPIMELL